MNWLKRFEWELLTVALVSMMLFFGQLFFVEGLKSYHIILALLVGVQLYRQKDYWRVKALEKKHLSLGSRGQLGTVFFWVYALIGVIFVLTVYIVFDNVLWAEEDSLSAALIPMGLNMTSTPMTTLTTLWDMWPIVFIAAWALALIIHSIVREPDVGMR